MKKKHLKWYDLDLTLFSETPASEGAISEPQMGGQDTEGVADLQSDENVEILYGKIEEGAENHEDEPIGDTEPADGEGDLEGEPGEKDSKDLSEEFESRIKGDLKPYFDNKVQNIVNKRFKETKALEERLERIEPVMDLLREKYNAKDIDGLLENLENEAYEELAYREGMDPEQYKRMKQLERENEQFKIRMNTEETELQMQKRVKAWYDEADNLKQSQYPDFNLQEASKNPEFLKMLQAGVSVKAAYEAAFFEQILNNKMAETAKKAKSNTVETIRSKKNRIPENGIRKGTGVIVKSDPSSLTSEDRAEIAKRVARGEEIKF